MFSSKIIISLLSLICIVAVPVRSFATNDDTTKAKKDTVQSASPRDGKYLILSYGSNPANPMRLGSFNLNSNGYKYHDLDGKPLGEGTFVYDVSEKQIKWQTGPFKAIGWSGDFSIDNNGKNHSIRLKNNTVGINSIE